jgi:NAD(P)H-dependent FMN reductase
MTQRPPRILAFAGSLRAQSYNKRVAENAAAGARAAGAEVRVLDLKEFPLPVYDADLFDSVAGDPHALEASGGKVGGPHAKPMPEGLLRLKEHFRWADGWIVSVPMHNGTYTASLHNLIDWLTRMAPGERPLDNISRKVIGVVSCVFAGSGSMAIGDFKHLMTTLGSIVVPGNAVVTITTHDEMFDAQGKLRDREIGRAVESTGARVVKFAEKLGLTGQGD